MSKQLTYQDLQPGICLTEQMMYDYIDGKLSPADCHYVEKHLLACELCSDAMEGLSLLSNRSISETVRNEIAKQTHAIGGGGETSSSRKKWIISIAAGLALLIGSTVFFRMLVHENKEQNGLATLPNKELNGIQQSPPPTGGDLRQDDHNNYKKTNIDAEQTEELSRDKKTASDQSALDETVASSGEETQYRAPDEDNSNAVADLPAGNTTVQQNKDAETSGTSFVSDATTTSKSVAPAPGKELKKDELAKAPVASTVPSSQTASGASADQSVFIRNDRQTRASALKKSKAEKRAGTTANLEEKNKEQISTIAVPETETAAFQQTSDDLDKVQNGLADAEKTDSIVEFPDTVASYPGGVAEMKKFLAKEFRYPPVSGNDVSGLQVCYVSFIVDRTGNLKDLKIVKGVDPQLNAEALRVVGKMPKWIPAVKKGKAVNSRMTIPIRIETR